MIVAGVQQSAKLPISYVCRSSDGSSTSVVAEHAHADAVSCQAILFRFRVGFSAYETKHAYVRYYAAHALNSRSSLEHPPLSATDCYRYLLKDGLYRPSGFKWIVCVASACRLSPIWGVFGRRFRPFCSRPEHTGNNYPPGHGNLFPAAK